MANPSLDQLETLCKDATKLLANTTKLQQLTEQYPDCLDRHAQNVTYAANPMIQAVQNDGLPRPTFALRDFLFLRSRPNEFARLYHDVEIVAERTRVIRNIYNVISGKIDRDLYKDQLTEPEKDFSDYLLVNKRLQDCAIIINKLIALYFFEQMQQ